MAGRVQGEREEDLAGRAGKGKVCGRREGREKRGGSEWRGRRRWERKGEGEGMRGARDKGGGE
jgi:hypothetical protein